MPELQATFLDVGQGDSTLVVLPDGGGVLVDCPEGSETLAVDYLERVRTTSLELVVITHSDLDHAGGVVQVVKSFKGPTLRIAALVDRVVKPDPHSNKKHRVILQELIELLRSGIQHWPPYEGSAIKFGDVEMSVLHPTEADRLSGLNQGNRNDCSVVLRIDYAGIRILLASDVQQNGWKWILNRNADLRADIFKFPHHGAWYNGDPSLSRIVGLVDPSFVVVSVGSTNGYGHPSIETLKLLRSLTAKVRFVCTQVTGRCHRDIEAISDQVNGLLPPESRGGHSIKSKRSCSCAGTVTVRISDDGNDRFVVSPSSEQHSRVIDLFDSPRCRSEN